jgi:uncharacterized protein (TIRG00374 family)
MSRRGVVLLSGAVMAVMLLALVFGLSNTRELWVRAREIRWGWVAAAAVAGLVSHACIGFCQHALLAALGKRLPAELVVRVSLVGSVVARSLRSGGASGFAFLTWYFGRLGVTAHVVASMLLGQLLLTNALFAGLAAGGFVWMIAMPLLGRGAWPSHALVAADAIVATLLTAGLVLAWVTLSSERLRGRWARRVEAIAGWFGRRIKRDGLGARAREVFDEAAVGVSGLIAGTSASHAAWAWAIVRVTTSFAALWLCVLALDVHVGMAGLVLAYVLGKMAGTMSLVPAGLGVIEGSLAGTLHAVGVPYEDAVLVALLNRLAYHLVPMAVALVVLGPLARRVAHMAANAEPSALR